MSFFGPMMGPGGFSEDPFFTSHHEHMRRMDQMMGNFMNPFDMFERDLGFPGLMAPAQPMLQYGENPNPSRLPAVQREQQQQQQQQQQGMVPFGFGRSFMMPQIGNLFQNFDRMTNDPSCHSYSSSSVMTYTTGEDGRPKVYQASTSTRSAPGGLKETKKTVTDSEAGMKKMAIGHHLGEKAHIIEKTQYVNTNEMEEAQEFINLDETEAEDFNRDWQRKAQPHAGHRLHELSSPYQRALPAATGRQDHDDDDKEARRQEKSRRKANKRRLAMLKPGNS